MVPYRRNQRVANLALAIKVETLRELNVKRGIGQPRKASHDPHPRCYGPTAAASHHGPACLDESQRHRRLIFHTLIVGFRCGPYLRLPLRAFITPAAAKSKPRNIRSTPGGHFISCSVQSWCPKWPAVARWLTLRQRASNPRSASTPPSRRCGAPSRTRAGSALCPER